MKYKIELLNCENLTDKQLNFLQSAVDNSASPFHDLNDYLWAAKNRKTLIFGVYDGRIDSGALAVDIRAGKGRKILTLSLLGGQNLPLWRDELVAFLFDLAAQNQCTDFTMLGRRGFGKLFPELQESGVIWTKKLI